MHRHRRPSFSLHPVAFFAVISADLLPRTSARAEIQWISIDVKGVRCVMLSYIYIYYNQFVCRPVCSTCYLCSKPAVGCTNPAEIYIYNYCGTELNQMEKNPSWSHLLANDWQFIMASTNYKALCWLFSLFIEVGCGSICQS